MHKIKVSISDANSGKQFILAGDEANKIALSKEQKKQLLAKYIREKLLKSKMKSNDFAGRLNRTPSEISKWLSGNHNFTIDTIFEIEEKLSISIINISDPPKKVREGFKKIVIQPLNAKLCFSSHERLTKALMNEQPHKINLIKGQAIVNPLVLEKQ